MSILTYSGRPIDCGDYIPPFSYTSKGWSTITYGRNIWFAPNGACVYSSGTTHKKLTYGTYGLTWQTVNTDSSSTYTKSISGSQIWGIGNNRFYSGYSAQCTVQLSGTLYVNTFSSWTGLTNFYGNEVWSDGTNTYVSDDWGVTYVLDISNYSWAVKTWNGFNEIYGAEVWSDGNTFYYSHGTNQYVLDSSTDTWIPKTWNGVSDFDGYDVWKLGDRFYCSLGQTHYAIDPSTSTVKQVYPGLNFLGRDVWSYDGTTFVSDHETFILSENTVNDNNFISYETT